jgi:hypothetical protein
MTQAMPWVFFVVIGVVPAATHDLISQQNDHVVFVCDPVQVIFETYDIHRIEVFRGIGQENADQGILVGWFIWPESDRHAHASSG